MRGDAIAAQHALKLRIRWKWVSVSRCGRFTIWERASDSH